MSLTQFVISRIIYIRCVLSKFPKVQEASWISAWCDDKECQKRRMIIWCRLKNFQKCANKRHNMNRNKRRFMHKFFFHTYNLWMCVSLYVLICYIDQWLCRQQAFWNWTKTQLISISNPLSLDIFVIQTVVECCRPFHYWLIVINNDINVELSKWSQNKAKPLQKQMLLPRGRFTISS